MHQRFHATQLIVKTQHLNHIMSIISIMSTKYIRKHVTITKDQNDIIKKKCLNLSRFLQQKLDEEFYVEESIKFDAQEEAEEMKMTKAMMTKEEIKEFEAHEKEKT